MTENKTSLTIEALHVQIRDSVKDFAEKLLTALGGNLQSITVVGSSLTDEVLIIQIAAQSVFREEKMVTHQKAQGVAFLLVKAQTPGDVDNQLGAEL